MPFGVVLGNVAHERVTRHYVTLNGIMKGMTMIRESSIKIMTAILMKNWIAIGDFTSMNSYIGT